MTDYICIRDCYYANPPHRFKVGDKLPSGLEPNKHFVSADMARITPEKKVYGPGDDPRSTDSMREELKRRNVFMPDAPRKELWNKLREMEGVQDLKAGPSTAITNGPKKPIAPSEVGRTTFDNPILNKNFEDWGPDDIDQTTAKEICMKLNAPPYSLDMKPTGITKADLVGHGLKIEEQIKLKAIGG